MASNFSSLRSARKNALDRLNEELKKESQKQGADERFWKLSVDAKTKIGYARLRFLPAPKNEDLPWKRLWTHGFKINGAWYIENCPTTVNRKCPCCVENNKLWNSGVDADKEVARDRKRKLNFISNILVLDDPTHPENNGKVFLFRYGQKIHDKVQELVNPKFPDQKPTDPFDFWQGADFKLKSQNQGGYQNYDKSEFEDAETLTYGKNSDEDYEALWDKEYSLEALVAEEQFKSYNDLEKRFRKVTLGEDGDAPKSAEEAIKREQPTAQTARGAQAQIDASEVADTTKRKTMRKPAEAVAAKPEAMPEPKVITADDDAPESEDDIKNFFAGVLND